jgi:hypothetical protein
VVRRCRFDEEEAGETLMREKWRRGGDCVKNIVSKNKKCDGIVSYALQTSKIRIQSKIKTNVVMYFSTILFD